ncbi:10678_t:CDS:2 [Funneliformis geosporum]|uniref:DNA excision repair protein ERCC-1 n=1 Tax=Funneliformis geosporum TaxID=1117311 RepID=A0A9W4T137_9GLOM|nr:10678_t:CDS:2 [Funneliformis geosporum]
MREEMQIDVKESTETTLVTGVDSASDKDNALPTSFHSSSIIDRKSKFVAHAKKATTKEEAESFWRKIQSTEKGATHNVLAYRIQSSDGSFIEEYHDDGETYAGNRVLTLLKTLEAKNVVVVVTRWFGGQLLGPIRFEHILKCSREVLDKGLLLNTNKSFTTINKRAGYTTNSIIVNGCQRGNPLLQFIRNVPWEFGDIVPDYVVGQTTCALFLSLRYQRLHPEYIYNRIDKLVNSYALRILLVLVDTDSHKESIRELTKICVINNFTMILSWSSEEAGRYLETYKAFEHKSPELIMEKIENNYLSKLTHCMTHIRSVNKTDVVTLASTFGSLKDIMEAAPEDMSICPGIGEQKVKRIQETFEQQFS